MPVQLLSLEIIRVYFLFDRTLLKELSRIAWEVLGLYYKNTVNKQDAAPAAIASIQTFGDLLGFNPHLHILCADGCFGKNGMFYAANIDLDASCLEPLFRHKILSMLKRIYGKSCKIYYKGIFFTGADELYKGAVKSYI